MAVMSYVPVAPFVLKDCAKVLATKLLHTHMQSSRTLVNIPNPFGENLSRVKLVMIEFRKVL